MNYKVYLPLHLLMHAYQWYAERQTPSYIPRVDPVDTQVRPVDFFVGWLSGINNDQVDEFLNEIPQIILPQIDGEIDHGQLIAQACELATLSFPRASEKLQKLAYTRRPSEGVASNSESSAIPHKHWALFGISMDELLDTEIPLNLRKQRLLRAYYGMTSTGSIQ